MKRIAFMLLFLLFCLTGCYSAARLSEVDVSLSDARYQPGNIEYLVELELISEEDLTKSPYITVREALQTIAPLSNTLSGAMEDLSGWYQKDALSVRDSLPDADKGLLYAISTWNEDGGLFPVLTKEDVLTIDLDASLSYLQALQFVTRLLGNVPSTMGNLPDELAYQNPQRYFQTAEDKNLVTGLDPDLSEDPIPRELFYEILHRALFVESIKRDFTMEYRVWLIDRAAARLQARREEVAQTELCVEMSVDCVIGEDLSITWKLPPEYAFLEQTNTILQCGRLSAAGEVDPQLFLEEARINSLEFLKLFFFSDPAETAGFRVRYLAYQDDYEYLGEWFFDISLSQIRIEMTDKTVEPGMICRQEDTGHILSVTLAKEQHFDPQAYYLINVYQDLSGIQRNRGVERVYRYLIRANMETDCIEFSENPGFAECHQIGGGYSQLPEEYHLQKLTITGNTETGWVFTLTPESETAFTIQTIERE